MKLIDLAQGLAMMVVGFMAGFAVGAAFPYAIAFSLGFANAAILIALLAVVAGDDIRGS